MISADQLARQLNLREHPEGGFYRETWRSEQMIETAGLKAFSGNGKRHAMSSILFLIPGETFSSLHRIKGEEIWNYHKGDAAVIFEIVDGTWVETELGPGPDQYLQHVIKPGTWFGSRCKNPAGYTLCGCTVVPGFEFEDFEMGSKIALTIEYPHLGDQIRNFTRLA